LAQRVAVNGRVTDAQSGAQVAQAIIAESGSHIAVVTNDDGIFTIKIDTLPATIIVSHVGYKTQQIHLTANNSSDLNIRLTPETVNLNEVTVWTADPQEIVYKAIRRIPDNYSKVDELHKGFYRETAMKRQHFIYVAEGVVDMYKTDYSHEMEFDRVAIAKGRRLISTKPSDTLGVKVIGGPLLPLQLDVAKNRGFFLDESVLCYYTFTMEKPSTIKDRTQFVVRLTPSVELPDPLFKGRLYIDRETLAITRAELSLDVSSPEKATRYMLVHKPMGVRFKPKELSFLIDYHYDNGVMRFSYVRSTFRFNCDWKRRLFATSFTAVCEMVVTDTSDKDVVPIKGRQSFDSRDAFYDKVDYFLDPVFWEDYNIIEPTETLDRAIEHLLKRITP